jgi:hypothetical protein
MRFAPQPYAFGLKPGRVAVDLVQCVGGMRTRNASGRIDSICRELRMHFSLHPARVIGPVAQLVEHRTFNAVVAGSSPARLTTLSLSFSAI